jgi:phenylpropionate dioxygenase-like ring-hydroxylating dioxygenase large terminal subunit
MDLNQDQAVFYQQARERCRADVDQMNNTIRAEWQHLNDEIKRVQELIQNLEMRKQTVGQIYASSSEMLGLANDLDISPAINEARPGFRPSGCPCGFGQCGGRSPNRPDQIATCMAGEDA